MISDVGRPSPPPPIRHVGRVHIFSIGNHPTSYVVPNASTILSLVEKNRTEQDFCFATATHCEAKTNHDDKRVRLQARAGTQAGAGFMKKKHRVETAAGVCG